MDRPGPKGEFVNFLE